MFPKFPPMVLIVTSQYSQHHEFRIMVTHNVLSSIELYLFFRKEFQLMASAPNDSSYHQSKTPINFWCKQGLNFRFLIQLSETLPIELTKTHYKKYQVPL